MSVGTPTHRSESWSDVEVRTLIKIWSSDHVQSGAGDKTPIRKKELFCKVSHDMRNVGFDRDWHQCRNKIKELKQEYRMALRCTSDQRRQTCKFFEELDGVLKKKHVIRRERLSLNGYRGSSLHDGDYHSEGHDSYFPSCSSLLDPVDNHEFLTVTQGDEPVEAYNESAFSHIEASFQTPKHQTNGTIEHSPPPRQKADKSNVSAKKKRQLVLRPSRELETVLETLVGRFLGFQRESEERFLKAQRLSQEGFLNYLRESEERFGRLTQVSEERWTLWQERWTKQERDREDARRREDGEQHLKMMQMLGDMLINRPQEKQRVISYNSAPQSPDITVTKESPTQVEGPSQDLPLEASPPASPYEEPPDNDEPPFTPDEAPPVSVAPEPMPRMKREPRNPLYRSSSDEDPDSLAHSYYDDQPRCLSPHLCPSADFATQLEQPPLSVSPGYDSHLQPDSSNSAEEAEESVFHHMNGNHEIRNTREPPRQIYITSGSEDVELYRRGKDELEREEYERKESGFTSGSEEMGHSPTPTKEIVYVRGNIHKQLKVQHSNSSASSDSLGPLRRSPVHAYPIKGAGPTTL